MDYGRAMRIVRTARGWAQKDLAKRADLDASYISVLERGERTPSTRTLQKLAKVLDIPFNLFLLLASDKEDLGRISPDVADGIGKQLLRVLIGAQEAKGEPKK